MGAVEGETWQLLVKTMSSVITIQHRSCFPLEFLVIFAALKGGRRGSDWVLYSRNQSSTGCCRLQCFKFREPRTGSVITEVYDGAWVIILFYKLWRSGLCACHTLEKGSRGTFENRRPENYGNWIKFWKIALNSNALYPKPTLSHFSFTTTTTPPYSALLVNNLIKKHREREIDERNMKCNGPHRRHLEAHVHTIKRMHYLILYALKTRDRTFHEFSKWD